MNKDDQKQFVESVCNDLKESLLKKIKDVPENWDGHELRQWVADFYTNNWVITTSLKGKRLRDYKNELIVKNLY